MICASAGNHAQGVAMSARKLGTRAVIVMPTTTPQVKIDAVQAPGRRSGAGRRELFRRLRPLAQSCEAEQGLTFVHPFDDPDVIAGQGTIAMEILRQLQSLGSRSSTRCSCAIGGGGLMGGVANYIKARAPRHQGDWRADERLRRHDAVRQARRARRRCTTWACSPTAPPSSWWARKPSASPRSWWTSYITVDTDAVCAAIKDIFVDTRSIVEPAGALAVAGHQAVSWPSARPKGETSPPFCAAPNMNFDRLRFVAERAEVGEEREAVLAVTIPEERGSFRRFCELMGKLPGGPRNVTEFNYRISDSQHAPTCSWA